MTSGRHYFLFILIILGFFHLGGVLTLSSQQLPPKPVDLCGGFKDLDLTPLSNFPFPWSVVKKFKSSQTTHQIDILTCQTFSSLPKISDIPVNCQNSSICHTITTSSQVTKSIGYVPVGVQNEYKTNLVSYVGSTCDDKLNYTIDIRFICGNNLGYPTYPAISISNACKTILHWETAAACKGSSANKDDLSTFGINESPCYAVDKTLGSRFDLSPLIRLNGSYKVWSSQAETDFYINVCSDATDKCRPGSSACFTSGNRQMESIGSYKWSSIEYKKASEAVKHDYVELTYKAKNSLCNGPISTLNESTTNIRFICPRQTSSLHRYPVLVSSLDCRYDIEWVTDYACSQEELTYPENGCLIEGVDLTLLQSSKYYEFKDIKRADGSNATVMLNVCGVVPNDKCKPGSSVCIFNSTTRTSFARRKANFVKADNRLSLNYVSGAASCPSKDGFKLERTIVELECDPSASSATSQPELIDVEECSYLFKWRTNHVCPLIMPSQLNCTFVSEELGFQMDLSALMLPNNFYEVQRYTHDPRLKYIISNSSRILLNVCSNLPLHTATNFTKECAGSAACLLEGNKNAISLGHFREPLKYDKDQKVLTLRYTGGEDPVSKKPLSTVINFHCESWFNNNEPYLIDYDVTTGQYMIEFNTPAACPLYTTKGTNCEVIDPISSFVYDLKPLASQSFYSIKSDKYDFELNVCQPIKNGSCGDDVAICQKEHSGDGRKFSLGRATHALSYWNTLLNMTFSDGTPYNDPAKTPRKSHISFICDQKAGNGFPEFAGEKDRSYFFRWYTALACPKPVPKVTHCVFENSTHFFDLSPLSLDRGNHFAFGKASTIAYINFCRPLNSIRDNMLSKCKANSGICLVDYPVSETSLGEPVSHPFLGFDGTIYMLYNNGDPCPANKSRTISSSVQLICSPDLDEDLTIDFFDPNDDPVEKEECTYNFVVRTPIACPRAFHDTTLNNCVYTDSRTNLSADLGTLTKRFGDYSVTGGNGPHSTFSLNMCKAVSTVSEPECKSASVCFRAANNSVTNYGQMDNAKLYLENSNLHVRLINGSKCDEQVDGRTRSTDIEFICDETAHSSAPTLYYQNHCLAKFQWRTSAVCNLVIPSCSLVDEKNKNYYSLRPLASMSHAWNVSTKADEYYLINVCKALPVNHNCSSSAGACKCTLDHNGVLDCSANLGKVSDHELTLDPLTGNLILTYDDGDKLCSGSVAKTQIRFRCSDSESGHNGPQLLSINDCTHHFVWDTIFACAMSNITQNSVDLSMDDDFVVHDHRNNHLQWDLHDLFNVAYNVTEKTRFKQSDNFTYVFDLNQKHLKTGNCANAAICQVKRSDGFSRDIGSYQNWKFSFVGADLYLVMHSQNSVCGRNKQKNVTSKIRFICNYAAGLGSPHFVFESQECDYFFTWETNAVCHLMENRPDAHVDPKRSGMSTGWIIFLFSLFALFAFAGWIFVASPSKRDDVVYHIRRLFRRNETPQIPFRYQQLSI